MSTLAVFLLTILFGCLLAYCAIDDLKNKEKK